jgi:urease accessory protein
MRTARRLHRTTEPAASRLILSYDARNRSRFRAHLENGEELAILLPRGTVLAHGDRLQSDDGLSYEVVAAGESLSVARTDDALLLARAAYHLGNRHVPLEVGVGRLAYQHDHVLDDMVRRLGLTLTHENSPFEPENGAYGHGHHHHGHHDEGQHDHAHEHHHESAHRHRHDHTAPPRGER